MARRRLEHSQSPRTLYSSHNIFKRCLMTLHIYYPCVYLNHLEPVYVLVLQLVQDMNAMFASGQEAPPVNLEVIFITASDYVTETCPGLMVPESSEGKKGLRVPYTAPYSKVTTFHRDFSNMFNYQNLQKITLAQDLR